MSRAIAVLRPEPGNAATAARIAAMGGTAIALPLFTIRAVEWECPDADAFDALILTSASALRMAGPALDRLSALPVIAVGAVTAAEARARGLDVIAVGTADAGALEDVARDAGVSRALHLAGQAHRALSPGIVAATRIVYASVAVPVSAEGAHALNGCVAMIHSPRAGRALSDLADAHGLNRAGIRIAAISPAAMAAAGDGWEARAAIERPDDDQLVRLAVTLAD